MARIFGRDRGALSFSYVLALPVVLLFLAIAVQTALWYLGSQTALAAARQGADVARANGGSLAAGPAAALQFAQSAGGAYLRDPVASAAGSTAQTVTITVSADVPSLVPGLVVHVSETASAPAENFRAAGRLTAPGRLVTVSREVTGDAPRS